MFSPEDGNVLVTCGQDSSCIVYDASTAGEYKQVQELQDHTSSITAAAFSPADLARCEEDFGNIVGAFVASTNGKPMMDDGDRRGRRGAHGPMCVNLFANQICVPAIASEMEMEQPERKRRGAHGASAVCAAIGATMPKPIGSMQQVLFNADLIETFGIRDADFTEEEEQSCVEQFGDIVGSASAALQGGMDESAAMIDAKSCTVLFANTICKEAVADEGLRSRRGAHSASAMCRKIVESAASRARSTAAVRILHLVGPSRSARSR